jgi:hypothetical protein
MSALPKDDLKAKGMNPFKCLKAKKKANTRHLEMSREKCMLQPKTLGTKGSTKAKHTRRVTTPTCNPEKPSNQNAHLKINLLPLSKTLITLKPSKGQKRTNEHKRASNMCQDAHHYKIKVHVNLICSIFSPLMSVLTTNEYKEMVWEA